MYSDGLADSAPRTKQNYVMAELGINYPDERRVAATNSVAHGVIEVHASSSRAMRQVISAAPEAFNRNWIHRFYHCPFTMLTDGDCVLRALLRSSQGAAEGYDQLRLRLCRQDPEHRSRHCDKRLVTRLRDAFARMPENIRTCAENILHGTIHQPVDANSVLV